MVLDRLLGLQDPGSDWLARVEARDRAGLALWVAGLALLWALGRTVEEDP